MNYVFSWLCPQFLDFPQVIGVGYGWSEIGCWLLRTYVLMQFFLMFTVILLKCYLTLSSFFPVSI